MGYAFTSTIIHAMKFIRKALKGELKVTSVGDVIDLTREALPTDPGAFEKKSKLGRKASLGERLWMGLNYFTMPAIVIEGHLFDRALFRSFKMLGHNIVDLYIKAANVNIVFRMMQYAMLVLSGAAGALLAYLFGRVLELNQEITLLAIGLAVPVFVAIGGVNATLILDNLNTAYITIMYIHTVDELNGKTGYTRFDLQKPSDRTMAIIEAERAKAAKKAAKKGKKGKKGQEDAPAVPEGESSGEAELEVPEE
jgi:hypothetical protein